MSLQVLTAASTANLIALASVKSRLGISPGDTSQDVALRALILGASSAMARVLGRPFARQRYQEGLAGADRMRLLLRCFPVDRDSVTVDLNGVAITDFSVEEASVGLLFRSSRWPSKGGDRRGEDGEQNVVATYKAGWILPDMITDWANGATLALGSWVRPSSPALSPYLFEVTVAGVAGGSEPTWPTTSGGTVVSGGVTFTARDAVELPAVAVDLAFLAVYSAYENRAPGVAGVSADGFSEQYFADHIEKALPPTVLDGIELLRYEG